MSSDFHDLDDFASLWAEEPSGEERKEFLAIAQRVSLRATLVEYADLGLGLLMALAIAVALVLKPTPATISAGLLTAGALVWSSWRRHMLKQVAALMAFEDRIGLVAARIERTRTELKRSLIGLWVTPPAILVGTMLTHSLVNGGSVADFGAKIMGSISKWPAGPVVAATIIFLVVQQVRLVVRLRTELRRLEILDGEYREEARLDRLALG